MVELDVRAGVIMAISAGAAIVGMGIATQFIADAFQGQAALGAPLVTLGGLKIYAPWSVVSWSERWAEAFPKPFSIARLIALSGFLLTVAVAASLFRKREGLSDFGKSAWAKFPDVESAGLFADRGAILGTCDGEIIAFDGPEHQILIGASRSGKGRGHVIPTLLSWSGSMLVLDVKGELDSGDPRHGFPGTSGYRAQHGPVFRFAPTRVDSNSFNPLLEVRRGVNEIRDVQNIVDMIVDPKGETRGSEQFWNNSGKNILTGLLLHVLYAEPPARKTLAVVREKLRDLDKTAEEMRATLHRCCPQTGKAEVHPEVLHAAQSYLAGEERLRSGVKATVESFFGLFADPIVADKTARSDFAIGDLMCTDRPVTLYLQPPPSDAQRLMPLIRLVIAQVARSLMEDQTHDGRGRLKQHRLLLVLDEFPQLGRLDFFEKMMGAMAGYGIKAYIVCQSLNHITRAYGRDNVILDNCHVVTAFAASDPETAKHIAAMAGEVWEIRPQESELRPRALFGPRKGAITYREERRPLMLPADVRGLSRNDQLIFVSGMKPLKARKLRFDRELVFAKRLLPPAPYNEGMAPVHDWAEVAPLGKRPQEKKTPSATGALRGARPRTPAPPQQQTDLFHGDASTLTSPQPTPTQPATTPPAQDGKISEIARAGFRESTWTPTIDVPPEAQPGPPFEAPADQTPRRRIRGTGV